MTAMCWHRPLCHYTIPCISPQHTISIQNHFWSKCPQGRVKQLVFSELLHCFPCFVCIPSQLVPGAPRCLVLQPLNWWDTLSWCLNPSCCPFSTSAWSTHSSNATYNVSLVKWWDWPAREASHTLRKYKEHTGWWIWKTISLHWPSQWGVDTTVSQSTTVVH